MPTPTGSTAAFTRLTRRRVRRVVDARGLAAIHRTELARGRRSGPSRAKLATVPELFSASRRRLRTPG